MSRGDFTLDESPQDTRAMLIAYITSTLSSEQRESFERRILEDEFFSRQIEEAQFALVDEYVAGSLPELLRRDVGAWIASSEHWRRHAKITRSLVKLSSSLANRRVVRRVLMSVSAAVFVTAAVTYSWSRLRMVTPETQTVAKVDVSSKPNHVHPPDTVLLVAERLRSATSPHSKPLVYQVQSGVPVRLQVVLPASHTSNDYSVTIRQDETGLVINFPKTTVRGPAQPPFLELMLPSNTLKAGDYAAEVSAPNDSYEVRFQIGK